MNDRQHHWIVLFVFISMLMIAPLTGVAARTDSPSAPFALSVTITSPTANAVVGSSSTTLTGTATPGAFVWVYIDTRPPVRVSTNASGAWSYTVTGLAQGYHMVTAEAELPERYLYASARSATGGSVYIYDADASHQQANVATFVAVEGIASHSRTGTIYQCTAGTTLSGTIATIRAGVVVNEVPSVRCSNLTTNALQTRLYVAVLDGWVEVYDITGGQNPVFLQRITVRTDLGAIHDPVFDPTNPDLLWVTDYSGTTYLVNVVSQTLIRTCPYGGRRLTISPDGQTLYIGDNVNDKVLFVSASTCQLLRTVDDPLSTTLEDLELSPDQSEVWVNVENSTQILAINRTTGVTRGIMTIGTSTGTKGGIITSTRLDKTFVAANNRIAVLRADGSTETLLTMNGVVYEFAWGSEFTSISRPFSVDLTSDVAITKTHTGNFIVGQQGQYTLSVRNNGPAPATAPVLITDTLPLGLTYVSATGTGWTCSATGQVVSCSNPTALPANATANPITLTVNVGAAAAPNVTNRACVGASNDDVSANDCSDDPTTVIPVADLSILKTSDSVFRVGQTGTYTLTVRNAGPSPAVTPRVTDTLPLGLTYVSATGTGWTCSATGQQLVCSLGTNLAANTTATPISVRVSVAQTAIPSVRNTATVGTTTSETTTTNNTSTVDTPVIAQADLSIRKTSDAYFIVGQTGTYTLTIRNAGPSPATAPLTVTDTLPTGLTYVSASGTGWACSATGQLITCTSATGLAVNATASPIVVRVTVGASAVPTVRNTANTTSSTADPNPPNNSSTITTPVLVPNATLIKSANPVDGTTVAANDFITYTLRFQNTGTLTLTNVVISDPIPAGAEYRSGSAIPVLSSGPSPVVWNLGTVAPNATRTVQFTVRVLPIGTTVAIINQATATMTERTDVQSNQTVHPFDPTAVTLSSFTVMIHATGPHVTWQTAAEADTIGFKLYRAIGTDRNQAILVTPSLISSQGSTGGSYAVDDPTAPVGVLVTYWLEEVTSNSTHDIASSSVTWHRIVLPLIMR